jgi:hypothetical protein
MLSVAVLAVALAYASVGFAAVACEVPSENMIELAKKKAKKFLLECISYRPRIEFPDLDTEDSLFENKYDKWMKADIKWRKNHPAGREDVDADHYEIFEKEFIE